MKSKHLTLDVLQTRMLAVGGVATLLSVAFAFYDTERFFASYLCAFIFWMGIALGGLAISMIHHLAGGEWGEVILPFFRPVIKTFPLMALFFVPILFGLSHIYIWADASHVAGDVILQKKAIYLNETFFIVRAAIYFLIWIGAAFIMHRLVKKGKRGNVQLACGLGLVAYGLSTTFASMDWIMSLEPHWYSTIFGLMFIIGNLISGMTFFILTVSFVLLTPSPQPGIHDEGLLSRFHSLGNLLLAFVMLWIYMAFSQFFIIWSANLPEEIHWYMHRREGTWFVMAMALALFHFAVPFVLLLNRVIKRSVRLLAMVALCLLVMRYVDNLWLVLPSLHGVTGLHVMDGIVFIALGGLWMSCFIKFLRREEA